MKGMVIPIITDALGIIPKGLVNGQEDLEKRRQGGAIQTTTLLRLVRILSRVLESSGNLLSLKLQ